VVAALEAALEGIIARGKANPGDKTMVDAIKPGIDALKEAMAGGNDFVTAVHKAVAATEAGMKSTIPMLALKGRASYLGERSIGHQDPGATSAFYIAQVMLETIKGIQ
jgi:dihydroxyacetone kinase-like protein